ncbi:MAG: hypothetical protein Kow0077_20340 [Anaerolineae bacterium]
MFRKTVAVLVVITVLLAAASVVLAGGGDIMYAYDEDSEQWLPLFDDGRLNAFDIDAPLAVYYVREARVQFEENGDWVWENGEMVYEDVIVSFEIWAKLPGFETFQQIVCCPIEELNAMVNSATEDIVLMESHGYTLGYSVSGYFWVSAPDGYSFVWER